MTLVKLYGHGFRSDSVAVAGSTLATSPTRVQVSTAYVSERELHIDVDEQEFPQDLLHIWVQRYPDGPISSTVTVSLPLSPPPPPPPPPAEAPIITAIEPDVLEQSEDEFTYLSVIGAGFEQGCTWTIDSPPGTAWGECDQVTPTSVRAGIYAGTPGSYNLWITNPGDLESSWLPFLIVEQEE